MFMGGEKTCASKGMEVKRPAPRKLLGSILPLSLSTIRSRPSIISPEPDVPGPEADIFSVLVGGASTTQTAWRLV